MVLVPIIRWEGAREMGVPDMVIAGALGRRVVRVVKKVVVCCLCRSRRGRRQARWVCLRLSWLDRREVRWCRRSLGLRLAKGMVVLLSWHWLREHWLGQVLE